MLKRTFELYLPYKVVIYVRMSDEKQNDRSPDQQIAEIRRKIKKLGLKWHVVKIYRDDAKKGALIRKRKAFQQLRSDIATGQIQVDLILIDSNDRFGRSEELKFIRHDLDKRYGVLVLTSESNFASPLTPEGQIYAAFDQIRATEENRIKAHQVVRAKRDTIAQGYWPGGPAPLGYKLKKITEVRKGEDYFLGSHLVVNNETKHVIRLAFERVQETGQGQSKVAKFLNNHPAISDDLKPFFGSTVGTWLKNFIYKGTLVWAANCTGIVDDVRKLEPNDPDDIVTVEDFCEKIVSKEEFDIVQAIRKANTSNGSTVQIATGDRLLKPTAGGATLKYMLTGLARCGHCRASMRPCKSGATSKTRTEYVYYYCPRNHDGLCENNSCIPEAWLRKEVITYLLTLFLK